MRKLKLRVIIYALQNKAVMETRSSPINKGFFPLNYSHLTCIVSLYFDYLLQCTVYQVLKFSPLLPVPWV